MTLPRARCPVCGRVVACNVPYGGDGSALVYRWHRQTPGGVLCPNSRQIVGDDEVVDEFTT